MKIKEKVFFIFTLLNINYLNSNTNTKNNYITRLELKKILKNYVRKTDSISLRNTENENLKNILFNKTLKNANTHLILNKIKYLAKIKKYIDIKYRCEYIQKYLKVSKKQVPIYLYYYGLSLEKLKEYDKSLTYYNQLLDIEEKDISNVELLNIVKNIYLKQGNIEKASNIENILN